MTKEELIKAAESCWTEQGVCEGCPLRRYKFCTTLLESEALRYLKGTCNTENSPSESTTTIGWATMPTEEKNVSELRLEDLRLVTRCFRLDFESYARKIDEYIHTIEELVK